MNATELAAISFNCPKTNLPPSPFSVEIQLTL